VEGIATEDGRMVRPESSHPRSFAFWLPRTKSSMPGASVINWHSRLIESPKRFLSTLSEVGYALRFAHEAGLLDESLWKEMDSHQSRARFLTWRLYRWLGRE